MGVSYYLRQVGDPSLRKIRKGSQNEREKKDMGEKEAGKIGILKLERRKRRGAKKQSKRC